MLRRGNGADPVHHRGSYPSSPTVYVQDNSRFGAHWYGRTSGASLPGLVFTGLLFLGLGLAYLLVKAAPLVLGVLALVALVAGVVFLGKMLYNYLTKETATEYTSSPAPGQTSQLTNLGYQQPAQSSQFSNAGYQQPSPGPSSAQEPHMGIPLAFYGGTNPPPSTNPYYQPGTTQVTPGK